MLNTIAVEAGALHNQFGLYWQDEDGNGSKFICAVYGFENACRVANGISVDQAEYVKHPGSNPFQEVA